MFKVYGLGVGVQGLGCTGGGCSGVPHYVPANSRHEPERERERARDRERDGERDGERENGRERKREEERERARKDIHNLQGSELDRPGFRVDGSEIGKLPPPRTFVGLLT